MSDTIELTSGEASATIALRGGEPISWRVGGRDLLWSGNPEHWEFRAPILFPRVGASTGGVVQVEGELFAMPQHGFARRARFALLDREGASARLRLQDSDATRAHYPFCFVLDVLVTLAETSLFLQFEVTNADRRPLPYAIGFHPAFPWPLDGEGRAGHRVAFAEPERGEVPEVAAGGLLARRSRRIPLNGRDLPITPDLFTEALVFLDARSRTMRFEAPSGAAIEMDAENFPHLAVWSRPTAPFLSLECWSGHADWEDAEGELSGRASMTILRPGETGHHAVILRWLERQA